MSKRLHWYGFASCLLLLGLVAQNRAESGKERLITRVYSVADLVIPFDSTGAPAVIKVGCAEAVCKETVDRCQTADAKAAPKTIEDRLMRLIAVSVAPRSWCEVGGVGTMDYFPLGMALVVTQTPEIQQQVADLLSALRRLHDVQVVLETRLLSVPDTMFERIGVDFEMKIVNDGKQYKNAQPCTIVERTVDWKGILNQSGIAILKDVEVFQLLEAAQGDRRTNVLMAPKMTLMNGQNACLEVGGEGMFGCDQVSVVGPDGVVYSGGTQSLRGFRFSAQPVVSEDRKRVHLKVEAAIANPELAKHAGVTVPDGGTVLIGGWQTQRDVRTEFGPPVLSKIPYLNRMFKNVGYGREHGQIILMVTPRIVIASDEETLPSVVDCPLMKEQWITTRPAETEAPPSLKKKATEADQLNGARLQKKVQKLVEKYREACAEGRTADAQKLAGMALALDPTCFGK